MNNSIQQRGLALRSDRITVHFAKGGSATFDSINEAGRDPRCLSGTEIVRVLRGQHTPVSGDRYEYTDGKKRESNRRKTVVVTHRGKEVFRGVAAETTRFIAKQTGKPLSMATLGRWLMGTTPQPADMHKPRQATRHLVDFTFELEEKGQ